jgi:hypothetical protein
VTPNDVQEVEMNTRTLLMVGALAATSVLAACASQQQEPRMMMGRGGQMPMGDMAQMCDMHQKMMAGKSPQEQQAMMEQHMKAMHGNVNPEMVAKHREMMEKNCAGMRQDTK